MQMCFSEAKTNEFSFKEMQIMSVKAIHYSFLCLLLVFANL